MAAGNYSFTIEQGATTDFELVYKDSNGDPIDLTNYNARMHLRTSAAATGTILVLSSSLSADGTGLNLSGSGGNAASKPPTSGSIGVYISHATSSNYSASNAVYDLELVSGSGNNITVTRLIQGKVTLSKEVTK